MLKRDAIEAGTALVVHLIFMCIFIYIHVYDASVVKKTKGKGFPGLLTYGGRWKYLTYLNLVSTASEVTLIFFACMVESATCLVKGGIGLDHAIDIVGQSPDLPFASYSSFFFSLLSSEVCLSYTPEP